MNEYSPKSRWELALHEAGHAVVGCVLGQTITGVSISAREDSYGRVEFKPPERNPSEKPRFREVKRYVVALLAGHGAQSLAMSGARSFRSEREWVEAELNVFAAVGHAEQAAELLDRLWEATRRLLRRHWKAVTQVAAELETAGQVSGAYVRELLEVETTAQPARRSDA